MRLTIRRTFGAVLCWILVTSCDVSSFCCSDIRENKWWGKNLTTCYVTWSGIDDNSCTTVRTDIKALSVEGQRKITELPTNIAARFPNLEIYDAGSCSITKISKSNFADLPKLRKLWLGFNQITEIPDDVFDDLASLDYLAIDSNKISSFGLHVFDKLDKLTNVHLEKNKCIDSNFGMRNLVLGISKIVEEKCCRPVLSPSLRLIQEAVSSSIEAQKKQLDSKNAEILNLEKALETLQKEKANYEQATTFQLNQKSFDLSTLKNTLDASIHENLALKKAMDELKTGNAASQTLKDLKLQQKDSEILELKRNLTLNLQEISTLKTLQSNNQLLTGAFAMLSNQIEQKDRTIVESSAKLSVLSEKISQKDNAINYLQQKVAMLKPCQEDS